MNLLTVTDIAGKLTISEKTARTFVNQMPHLRIGKRLYVRESEFEAWLETRRVAIQRNETAIAVLQDLFRVA